MAIDTSNTEPISIIPGDTVKWARRLADFPASGGWALSYELLNAMHRYEIVASADGDAFRVVVSAQTTQAFAPVLVQPPSPARTHRLHPACRS
ncbi:hypothetical protein [Variovorax paradoxus]|uniref:hypothetical protein n=1 Tax=Variovorax paradoxus TaxID=34073 RepID=UPI003D64715F